MLGVFPRNLSELPSVVFSSWCVDKPSKSSIEFEYRSEQVPSSRVRDRILGEETPDWVSTDDVVYLPICTDYLYQRSVDESELHTLIVLLCDECFRDVIKHRATVIIDVVPECLSPLLVFWKDQIIYSYPLHRFFEECLEHRLIFARAPVPNADNSVVSLNSIESLFLIGASGKVMRECY